MIIIAILLPGLSFLVRGKLIAALLAIFLQIIAVFTFLLFGIGFMLWLVLAIWAVLSYQNARAGQRHKQMIKAMERQRGR